MEVSGRQVPDVHAVAHHGTRAVRTGIAPRGCVARPVVEPPIDHLAGDRVADRVALEAEEASAEQVDAASLVVVLLLDVRAPIGPIVVPDALRDVTGVRHAARGVRAVARRTVDRGVRERRVVNDGLGPEAVRDALEQRWLGADVVRVAKLARELEASRGGRPGPRDRHQVERAIAIGIHGHAAAVEVGAIEGRAVGVLRPRDHHVGVEGHVVGARQELHDGDFGVGPSPEAGREPAFELDRHWEHLVEPDAQCQQVSASVAVDVEGMHRQRTPIPVARRLLDPRAAAVLRSAASGQRDIREVPRERSVTAAEVHDRQHVRDLGRIVRSQRAGRPVRVLRDEVVQAISVRVEHAVPLVRHVGGALGEAPPFPPQQAHVRRGRGQSRCRGEQRGRNEDLLATVPIRVEHGRVELEPRIVQIRVGDEEAVVLVGTDGLDVRGRQAVSTSRSGGPE